MRGLERASPGRRAAAGLAAGPVSAGFVGTYPPTRCGIATFTYALRAAMALPRSGVVASVDAKGAASFGPEVVAELVRGSPRSLAAAAGALAEFDLAVIQHEFGIYGGADGDEVLDLVGALDVPALLVLHTVLRAPSAHQREIVEELGRRVAGVAVQSGAARARLLEAYDIDPARVHVVAHGAQVDGAAVPVRRDRGRRPVVLTWGLLGPSKGVEFGIEALAHLRDLDPLPRYVVHGQTHPRVVEHEGEAYRTALQAHALKLGVGDMIEFEDRYVDTGSVLGRLREADVVLLPYRSRDQVVSGVLVEAIASGKPVVATRFPHAEELLGEGSGILVPHEDPVAIALALRRLLTDDDLHLQAARVARRQAPSVAWENVGRSYRRIAASLVRSAAEASR